MEQRSSTHAVIEAAFPGRSAVPVVLAASAAFVPVCAIVIRSLAKSADPERLYDVVVLHREIDGEGQALVARTVRDFPNVSVRFYNTSEITDRFQLRPIEHIPIETYYRFLIPEIIVGYEKVLYLDCDLVCLKDVGKLYDTDLGDNWIAAVKDVDMQGQAARDRGMKFYLQDRLGMKDPSLYFQAGVLLLNTIALKEVHTTDEWLTFASEEYRYGDQDILNRFCRGHVLYLDMTWNVLADCGNFRVPVLIEKGPSDNKEAYREARKDPAVVHYAGREKPWNTKNCDLASCFWEIARETPLHQQLQSLLNESAASRDPSQAPDPRNGERRAVRFFKRICPHFLFSFARKIKRALHL
ncbi:MAG: glycosyltransferase family 8 protein [Clostridia bacterium]|nr:glycosyltransferase family 8 protein [Clostridia bacterium]